MRLNLLAAALFLAVAADASGQAYKWIDKEGRVHYTQTPPPPDARKVEKKTFRNGPTEAADLPYATREASRNFPVTLYVSPDCGPPCDNARALLVKRSVPFREVSLVTQAEVDEMKSRSGGTKVPTLLVGTQVQVGFLEGAFNGLLDSAGYPSSVPPLPIEALRKTEPATNTKDRGGDRTEETSESGTAAR